MITCIHGEPLDKPCDQCEGKASDGGWDGYGWRIVDGSAAVALRAISERIAAIERWIDERESYESEQRET